MPVYNGVKYLNEAIESILNQTFNDFEFLIIDDGSTDQSINKVQSYDDPRIKLIKNKKNIGQSATLNIGIELAKGEYIAIMDQDDISMPNRLKKQVEFMEKNQKIVVCGSWIELIGKYNFIAKTETEDELIKINLLTNHNLAHPTVMIRKQILKEKQLSYDTSYTTAQDYELWVRMFECCLFANLPEPLVKYRTHKKQKSLKDGYRSIIESKLILGQFFNKLKFPFDEVDLDIHWKIFTGNGLDSLEIIKVFKYINRLRMHNLNEKIFNHTNFNEFLRIKWRRFMLNKKSKILYWISALLFFRPVQYSRVIRNRMYLDIINKNITL